MHEHFTSIATALSALVYAAITLDAALTIALVFGVACGRAAEYLNQTVGMQRRIERRPSLANLPWWATIGGVVFVGLVRAFGITIG